MSKRYAFMTTMLFLAGFSAAQTPVPCPAAPVQVQPQITSTTSFDSSTNLYTYNYTLGNGAGANQEISDLAIDVAGAPSKVQSPHGWSHGLFKKRSTIHWAATLVADDPNAVDDSSIPPGVAQIKPGTSVSGFSFQSSKPPGPVKFFARGYVHVLFDTEVNAENALTDCAASLGNFFNVALVGTTTGPVNFIPVAIAIKPMAPAPVPINPRDKGVTPVAILSTPSFDAGTVDPASLTFGTGGATPLNGKGHLEDVNNDGLPDLVVQFPSPRIGARCNDTALFLTGATFAGTPIQGSETIQTVGCNSQNLASSQ
jgi:hypothetical protein